MMHIISAFFLNYAARHRLVAHWGQNGVYYRKKERKFWEEDLVSVCNNREYDTVIIGFLNIFFDPKNKGEYGIIFQFHSKKIYEVELITKYT